MQNDLPQNQSGPSPFPTEESGFMPPGLPSSPKPGEPSSFTNIPLITSSSKGSKSKKIIPAIIGLLLLVGAVVAGLVLIRQRQEIRERAAITGTYKVEVLKQNPDGSRVTLVGAKPKTIVRYQEANGSPSSPRVCYQGNNDGQCPQSNDCFGATGIFQKPLNTNGAPCNSIKPGWYAVHWDKTISVAGVTYNIVPTGNVTCEGDICSQIEGLVYEGDHQYYHYAVYEAVSSQTPTPTPTPTGTGIATPTATPTSTATGTGTGTGSPTPTATSKASATPTKTATPTPTGTAGTGGTTSPTQAPIPESGTSWPTITGVSLGILILLASLLLAL